MEDSRSNLFKRRPLSFVLIVPFVLQTFAIASLVGYLAFRNGQRAVVSTIQQLETEVSERVEVELERHLSLPQQINQINASVIEQGLLDLSNVEQTGYHFWRQAKLFESTSFIGYATPAGEGGGAGRWVEGEDLVIFEGNSVENDYTYRADAQGNLGKVVESYDYDPLTDYWYVNTVEAGTAIWNDIYVTPAFEGYISASATSPVYDDNGQLQAVLAVDYLLSDLNELLYQIEISPNGRAFIMQRDGKLIGNSSDTPTYVFEGEEGSQILATDSEDETIRRTALQIQQTFPVLDDIETVQRIEFKSDGQYYFARVTPWQDEYGLDWLVVTTLPKSDFTASLQQNARNTALLSLAGLAAAIAIATVTSRWITRPIKQLMTASQQLASGQLDKPVEVHGIKEVETLGAAFNQMAGQLKQSFQALQSSNQELEATNDELEQRVEDRTADLQQTLAELKQTQARLLQQEKMSSLGQLVAGVAHEVNNPVNFIYGNITPARSYAEELLELVKLYQTDCPTPSDEVLDRIEDLDLEFVEQDLPQVFESMKIGAERIREIVKSLRNFSRLDEAELKEADLHQGLESTLMILQNQIKHKPNQAGIEIIKDYSELPKISCYPGQLNQVFMNLLSNSIDALAAFRTADSDRKPTIHLKTQVIEGEKVSISISDNGPGIPEDVQAKIFDPFFTTKPVGQGTGLGLSISYQIVTEKHDGQLLCHSNPDQGTEFVIELPISLQTSTAPTNPEPPMAELASV